MTRKNTEEDFWNRVDISGGPDACWNWNGRINTPDKRRFKYNGEAFTAPQFSYFLTNKNKSDFIFASCLNKDCCNPKHLSSVTRAKYIDLTKRITKENFWQKVNIKTEKECWPWSGYIEPGGYGRVYFFDGKRSKRWLAHRLAFYLKTGLMPEAVCHTCDNPICCNTSHLWAGTRVENNADREKKGRSCLPPRGERNPSARLKEVEVLKIRRLVTWFNPIQLSKIYGVGPETIRAIVARKTWKHI